MNYTAKSRTTTSPPGYPIQGDTYLVPSGATGAWAGGESYLAIWLGGSWVFQYPDKGDIITVVDECVVLIWSGCELIQVSDPTVITPPGTITQYAGSSPPSGWLSCVGQLLARADYPALFSAIGTLWDVGGEPATHFRLPDFQGRSPMGDGAGAGLTARNLGGIAGYVGVETVDAGSQTLAAGGRIADAGGSGDLDDSTGSKIVGVVHPATVCLFIVKT